MIVKNAIISKLVDFLEVLLLKFHLHQSFQIQLLSQIRETNIFFNFLHYRLFNGPK